MDRHPISQEGYDKLREEIRHLENEVLPDIAQRIADARAEGDLKENAEYHAQREAQGMTNLKISKLKSKLASCYIADKSSMPKGQVTYGSVVTVKNLDDGLDEKYEFVGPGEEDYMGEVHEDPDFQPAGSGSAEQKSRRQGGSRCSLRETPL